MKETTLDEQDSSFWIDYLEGEVTPSMQEDLELLLAHSPEHRKIVDGYRQTRELVETCDDGWIPMREEYYQRLENKIMKNIVKSEIENTSIRRSVKNKIKNYFSLA